MRRLPAQEELVAVYWRKLANSIGAAYKSRRRVLARHAVRALQKHRGRSRSYGAAKGVPLRQAAH